MIISIIENDINDDENDIIYEPTQEVPKSGQDGEIWTKLEIWSQ